MSGIEETADEFATLLSEGLDLCVRARSLDEAATKKAMRDYVGEEAAEQWPDTYGRSGTPALWLQQQYDTDLADWETRARSSLIKRGFAR